MRRTQGLAAMAMCMLLVSASFVGAGPQRGGGAGGVVVGGGHPNGGYPGGGHPVYATRGSYVFVGGYFYDPYYEIGRASCRERV